MNAHPETMEAKADRLLALAEEAFASDAIEPTIADEIGDLLNETFRHPATAGVPCACALCAAFDDEERLV